jgi:uncharacterized protein (TIGR02145 family)
MSDGTYALNNIIPGTYELSADHETYLKASKTVVVQPAYHSKVDFILEQQPFPGFSEVFLDYGFDNTQKSFIIENIGSGVLKYHVTTEQSWITLSSSEGEVSSIPDTIRVSIDTTDFNKTKTKGWITVASYLEEEVKIDTIDVLVNGVSDVDGNHYGVVTIGTQSWLSENLNTGIQVISNQSEPEDNGVIEKYCWGDLKSNCDTYGGLYWWDEMMAYGPSDTSSLGITQGICPEGWHLPTLKEWDVLIEFLGGYEVAGTKLKSESTLWDPNTIATNESGFSLLPGGATFSTRLGSYGRVWTSSKQEQQRPVCLLFHGDQENVYVDENGKSNWGLSVRCLKDPE